MHVAFLLLSTFLFQAGPQQIAPVKAPEITFLVASDPHYGLDQWANNETLNKQAINRMNGLEGTSWPAAAGGGSVDEIRGVLMPGDLTDSGTSANLYGFWFFGHIDGFADDYKVNGASGSGRLDYNLFEGYGNHDIHNSATGVVLSELQSRNLQRPDVVNISGNGLHYSFDWGPIHLVNLNLYPGGAGDAEDSLGFLIQDLAAQVGNSSDPVVLYHHYGFDPFGRGWWTNAERSAYFSAISGYNVIAIFNGHSHGASYRTWNSIPVFNAPRVTDQNYLAVRIANHKLTVAVRNQDNWGTVWVTNF